MKIAQLKKISVSSKKIEKIGPLVDADYLKEEVFGNI